MLQIDCPYCGVRPEVEFEYCGEAHIARPEDPAQLDDQAWSAFLYHRSNRRGLHAERWRHTHGCARYFNAVRDTASDRFLLCYAIGVPPPDLELLARTFAVGERR